MHKKLVFSIVFRILLFVCLVMLVPLGWAVYDNPSSREVSAFVTTILFGIVVSLFFRVVLKINPKDYEQLSARDGLAIVGLSWVVLSVFGALPLYLNQTVPTFTDAFFEVVSGFTTTGASVLTDIEVQPRGILFWRSLTHWLGGMGIIVLYLALLPAIGPSALQLYKAEVPGIAAERVQPRIRETAKILWTVYFLLSAAQTALMMAGGMPFFDALCHTFGTMATGGFSTKSASIGYYDPYIQWVVIVFMFLAGTNFLLHYLALRGQVKAYFKSEEFRIYFGAILLMIAFFAVGLHFSGASDHPVRHAAFQVVSIFTTTGFVTADFNAWPHVFRILLLVMMFVGGCGGSTGGGMKVIRTTIAAKVARRSVVQAVFPSAVMPIRYDGKPLSERIILQVACYFLIYMMLFFVGSGLFVFLESCDLVTAFAATVATLSNIGPGLGQVGATQNYAWVSIPGKWLLSFLMLAGRLELYSILILLFPLTWRR